MASRGKCGECDRPVVWVKSAASGKPMPIDPTPVDIGGNVWLDADGAHVVKKGEPLPSAAMYVTHFATCPARMGNADADDVKIADPLAAVRRIRREIEEERRGAKKAVGTEDGVAAGDEAVGSDRVAARQETFAVPVGEDSGS